MTIDVLVVGGGPAGSYTAHALARAGARITLLDRARFPRAKPCAEFLSPECSRLLDSMDALEHCRRAAHARLAGMTIRAPGGLVIEGSYARAAGGDPRRMHALSIRREVLDALLLDRAMDAGAAVHQQLRATALLRDHDGRVRGVHALDASGSHVELRADIVVGADGLRSVVARRLGLATRDRFPTRLGLVGHWTGVGDAGAFGEMHVERDGFVGLADVGGGVTNISMVVPATRSTELSGDAAGFYERWLRAKPQLAVRLRGARRIGRVMATGPFATRARRSWAPGAALVGDAAGYYDPFTGEGIYSALRGGELLVPHLLQALGAPNAAAADAALQRYDRVRRREFTPRRTVERAISLFVAHAPLMNHAARALVARRDMADLLVGVCGDFIPPWRVLQPGYVARLLAVPFLQHAARRLPAGAT